MFFKLVCVDLTLKIVLRVSRLALNVSFTLGLSLVTGVTFGLIPAIQTARIDVNSAMKEEGRGGTSSRAARRFGDALIVAEVALALVLLIGAGQMLLTFARMQGRDPGLDPEVGAGGFSGAPGPSASDLRVAMGSSMGAMSPWLSGTEPGTAAASGAVSPSGLAAGLSGLAAASFLSASS